MEDYVVTFVTTHKLVVLRCASREEAEDCASTYVDQFLPGDDTTHVLYEDGAVKMVGRVAWGYRHIREVAPGEITDVDVRSVEPKSRLTSG